MAREAVRHARILLGREAWQMNRRRRPDRAAGCSASGTGTVGANRVGGESALTKIAERGTSAAPWCERLRGHASARAYRALPQAAWRAHGHAGAQAQARAARGARRSRKTQRVYTGCAPSFTTRGDTRRRRRCARRSPCTSRRTRSAAARTRSTARCALPARSRGRLARQGALELDQAEAHREGGQVVGADSQVKPVADDEMFKAQASGKRKKKAWKRMVTKVTFVGPSSRGSRQSTSASSDQWACAQESASCTPSCRRPSSSTSSA